LPARTTRPPMAVTDRSHRLLSWLARVAKSVPATCSYANSVVALPALARLRRVYLGSRTVIAWYRGPRRPGISAAARAAAGPAVSSPFSGILNWARAGRGGHLPSAGTGPRHGCRTTGPSRRLRHTCRPLTQPLPTQYYRTPGLPPVADQGFLRCCRRRLSVRVCPICHRVGGRRRL